MEIIVLGFVFALITNISLRNSENVGNLKQGVITEQEELQERSNEPSHEKTCLCPMQTTQVQISLRISAV